MNVILSSLIALLALAVIGPIALAIVIGYRRDMLTRKKTSRILQDQRPSFTAEMVCWFRAMATSLNWCNDNFAFYFLDLDARLLVILIVTLRKIFGTRLNVRMVKMLSARTWFLDKFVIENAPKQIVILGAGLDARAYRLWRNLDADARFFEVDAPATQKMKREKLATIAREHPDLIALKDLDNSVSFVSCDFSSESFVDKLVQSGFDINNPKTVVLLEGVASYLTRTALTETLKGIASLAPGTRLAMNIPSDARLKSAGVSGTVIKDRVGEEWKGSWRSDEKPEDYFGPLGFKVLTTTTFELILESMPIFKHEPKSTSDRADSYVFVLEVEQR